MNYLLSVVFYIIGPQTPYMRSKRLLPTDQCGASLHMLLRHQDPVVQSVQGAEFYNIPVMSHSSEPFIKCR